MPGLINYGRGQYGAVAGGRRRRFPYRDIIYAAQPQIYAKKAREEDVSYRQRRLASEKAYRERVLAEEAAYREKTLEQAAKDLESRERAQEEAERLAFEATALRREQLRQAKKEARTSTYISGAQTGILGGYAGYKAGLFKGGGLKTAGKYALPAVAGYYGGGVAANQPQLRESFGTALTGGHGTDPQKGMMTGGIHGAGAGFLVGGPPGAIIGGVSGAYKGWKEAGGEGGFGGFMKESTYGPFMRKGFVRESIRDPIKTIKETIKSPKPLLERFNPFSW